MKNENEQTMNNRHEFYFCYDVRFANPNGDPLSNNQPRQDRIREKILVSDDRIKRTVRDTLKELGYDIFIESNIKEDGTRETKEEKIQRINGKSLKNINKFPIDMMPIDIKLFGGVFALKNKEDSGNTKEPKAFSLVGPVQIAWGESLHKVAINFVKGSTVMPSNEGKKQGTFTEEYKVPYAFIYTYGIINENNAKKTELTDKDIDIFFKALWLGHSRAGTLETTSKLGHTSRLLIDIVFKENEFCTIGDQINLIRIKLDEKATKLDEKAIRCISEFELDLSNLKKRIEDLNIKDKIEKIRYKIDPAVRLSQKLEELFKELNKDLKVEELDFNKS
ncbi:MAG: type I-B CRISPR-associated protein Cas7/Csh2 [Candidatus Aenigmatarchaeota archaeon]|nr:type I-B CRISPR-associated protein Cas7/Csh2 [Candidatus Rehaiarchaeum fermentans]